MIKESVHLIVDKIDKRDEYHKSIELIRSFGLKCDTVGWSRIEINNEQDLKLIKNISQKAHSLGGHVRILYDKTLTGEADWYVLSPSKEITSETNLDIYKDVKKLGIRAYRMPENTHAACLSDAAGIAVSEQFVQVCSDNGLTGVDFYWMRDISRYKAMPFYYLKAHEYPPMVAVSSEPFEKYIDGKKVNNCIEFQKLCDAVDSDGGNLSKIAAMVDEIQQLSFPVMASRNKMPNCDFCSFVTDTEDFCCGILISSKAARILTERKLIKSRELFPVPYIKDEIFSILATDSYKLDSIDAEVLDFWESNRKQFEAKRKQQFVFTEKDALKALRNSKYDYPEYFKKGAPKKLLASFEGSQLEVLFPVYKISNGGQINDEYELFPIQDVETETNEWIAEIMTEEDFISNNSHYLKALKIGWAADGDSLLFMPDETIVRMSHEAPDVLEVYTNMWDLLMTEIE